MGKSIRSKSVLKAKSIKRAGEFTKIVDARNKRISEKLTKDLSEQAKLKQQEKEAAGEVVDQDETKSVDKMDEDQKKISTSGWKNSRKSIYKQSLIKNKKKKNHMKF